MKECPDKRLITEFLRGNVGNELSVVISEHVRHCETCSGSVAGDDARLGHNFELEFSTDQTKASPISTLPDNDHQLGSDSGRPDRGQPTSLDALNLIQEIGKARDVTPVEGTSDPNATETSDRIVGNYVLSHRIAGGAMGDVYYAYHTRFEDRRYAIKLVRHELASEYGVSRFQQEIQAMGKLSHENLVFAVDAGITNEQPYLVMELVDGHDLQEILDKRGPLSVGNACELVRQACLGIQHAHENGIVHRDLKPSNILLDRFGLAKVLDLGLASLRDAAANRLTTDDSVMGTASYMAPEQWKDSRNATPRSDVYSLACTLYCLLSGRPPFSWDGTKSATDLMYAHLHHEPKLLAERDVDVPTELSSLLEQALAKDPDNRILSALEFSNRLLPFCHSSQLEELIPVETASIDSERRPWINASIGAIEPTLEWSRNEQQAKSRPGHLVMISVAIVALGVASLAMANYGPGSTPTWRFRFDQLASKSNPHGLGFVIDVLRTVLFVSMAVFLAGTRFSREFRVFVDLRRWDAKLTLARLLVGLVVGYVAISESVRMLSLDRAPTELAAWGIQHGFDTRPELEAVPYRWNVPYTLIFYVVSMAGLFAFPLLSFALSDFPYMKRQVAEFIAIQSRTDSTEAMVANLQKFAMECRRLSGRYLDVCGALCIAIHYQYWIGSLTLTEASKSMVFVGYSVVGIAAVFVLAISTIYQTAFHKTNEKAAGGSVSLVLSLSQMNLLWFLKTTVLFHIGGIALLSLIAILFHSWAFG